MSPLFFLSFILISIHAFKLTCIAHIECRADTNENATTKNVSFEFACNTKCTTIVENFNCHTFLCSVFFSYIGGHDLPELIVFLHRNRKSRSFYGGVLVKWMDDERNTEYNFIWNRESKCGV